MMESSNTGTDGKSSNIIVRGVKFIIKKIIELAKKIKNFIRNLFKPNNEKKVKDLHDRDQVINSALSEYNITRTAIKITDTASSITSLANKAANDGHNIKKGHHIENLNNSDISQVVYTEDGNILVTLTRPLINILKYLDTVKHLIIPVFKSKFKNKSVVDKLKQEIGPNGDLIPALHAPLILDTNKFFKEADLLIDSIIDVLNYPEVKEMSDDGTTDPYFHIVLDGLMTTINTINMALFTINNSIKFLYENPFNNYELNTIKDGKTLGEIVRYILLKSKWKNSIKGYNLVKPLIQSTAVAKGWTEDINDSKAGATRITVITKDRSQNLYKYAWNKKGIFDNKQDLKIKKFLSKYPTVAELLALPTGESDDDGVYVVVPRAKTNGIDVYDVKSLQDKLDSVIKKSGLKMIIHDIHRGNVGKINGKLVVIDYGNFVVS